MTQENINSSALLSLSSKSPTFTSYSSERLADIAARVLHDLNISHDNGHYDDFDYSIRQDVTAKPDNDYNDDNDEDEEESEFEFAVLSAEDMPVAADEIFHNGQIKPIIYPVFGRTDSGSSASSKGDDSSSSSEDDELDRVAQETYCIWTPKKKNFEGQDGKVIMKKKSNSMGSGSPKRWRFKDLLHKSNSDGKDTFIFLTTSQQHHKNHKFNDGKTKRRMTVTPVNNIYGYNGLKKTEGMKKTSYLPYRQDLVGLFSTVNRRY